jgi:AcrR family transcriptional regulator
MRLAADQVPIPPSSPPAAGAAFGKSPRARLLDVASELFYRRGIRSVGIDEVIATAGVAKMSLYRSFPSKDELVAAYLRERSALYWKRWEATVARHPGRPRKQLLALASSIGRRSRRFAWRGCPFTNAATEFPERGHPGRRVALANKREMRRRLRVLAKAAGARDPALLADQLTLLIEGTYSCAVTFGSRGPGGALASAAKAMIKAQIGSRRA